MDSKPVPVTDTVCLEGLSMRYSSGVQALDRVNLQIENGVFGIGSVWSSAFTRSQAA